MPQFNEYESGGRRLAVEFTCYRCNGVRFEPLEPLVSNENYGYLHNINLPDDWRDIRGLGLFCPTCSKELAEFIRAGVNEGLRKEPIQ